MADEAVAEKSVAGLQEAASKAMAECCALVGNRDIEPVVPALMSCMARPTETSDCITKVSCTTFVQVTTHPTPPLSSDIRPASNLLCVPQFCKPSASCAPP